MEAGTPQQGTPGPVEGPPQEQQELGLRMLAMGIGSAPETMLNNMLEICHKEYERRNPDKGKWALVTE